MRRPKERPKALAGFPDSAQKLICARQGAQEMIFLVKRGGWVKLPIH
jgi:hypothetical protein